MSKLSLKLVRTILNSLCVRLFSASMLGCLLVLIFNPALQADEIYFKSGYSHTGVIVRENADAITFKTDMGISTVSKDMVDFVERASKEDNQSLLKKWREKELQLKEAEEAKRIEEKRFEEAQLAKGLVKFEDKWVTPEEKARVLDLRDRAVENRRQFEADQQAKGLVRFQYLWVTPEHAKELKKMQPEIYRLHDDIAARNKMVDSLRLAMATTSTIEEADKFSQRIEEIEKSITEKTDELGKLLDKVDEIEAASVRYTVPEEFRDVMPPDTQSQ